MMNKLEKHISMKRFLLFITVALPMLQACAQEPAAIEDFVILGDSYSTFDGYIPEGNASWYFTFPNGDCDVVDVSQTWWKQFAEETGYELLRNESWSGSTICNTGYGGEDCSTWSFIARMERLFEDGNQPDLILIFGATNDSWANAPVGELQYSDWSDDDLHSCLPAFCYMLDWLKKKAPEAEIVSIINSELKYEIVAGIMQANEHYGTRHILLKDIHKLSGHPSIKGMEAISDQVSAFVKAL